MSEEAQVIEKAMKYTGLPVYEDGRGFKRDHSEIAEFSLRELEEGRKVTLVDDKDRKTTFVVGHMDETDFTHRGMSKKVPSLSLRELEGDGLENVEVINASLFDQDGGAEVNLYPPREKNQKSPVKNKGLRLTVNPWTIYPIAVSKIEIHENPV